MTVQRARYFFCGLLLFATFLVSGQGGTKIISAGSYIVDMGQEPQTIENSLKPYGLIYELVSDYQVPVLWSIKPDKVFGGVDFSIGNTDYKAGPFIIEEEYLDVTSTIDGDVISVRDAISIWESKGVVGNFTQEPISIPIYNYIVTVPKILVFETTFNVLQYISTNAGISLDEGRNIDLGRPGSLADENACFDLYILGDIEAIASEQVGLQNFITQRAGNVVLLGKSASTTESLDRQGGGILNFLTTSGLECYSNGRCENELEFHGLNSIGPYNYNSNLADAYSMQFLGQNLHLATENSGVGLTETYYSPLVRWADHANVIIQTANRNTFDIENGAKLITGRAFGEDNNGRLLYLAGNDLNSGTAGDVAAQRVLLNFILQTGIDKSGTAELQNFDQPLVAGTGQTVSTTINDIDPQSFTWRSTCGGSIQGNTDEIIFTPENTNRRYECELSVVATDECGRSAFGTTSFTVFPINGEPQPGEDDVLTNGATPLTIDVLANDSDPQPDDALTISRILAEPVNGSVSISNNQLIYTGNDDEYIADSLYYEVCDDGIPSLCVEARVLITNELQLNTAPIVEDQTFEIIAGQNTDICIVATDNEDDELEITELSYDGPGELVNANPNDLCFKFLIEEEFTSDQIVTVQICDIRENFLCTTASITLTNIPDPEPDIIVSKALTPNNDGDNDTFVIQGINAYPENRVMVYDRWGGVVFETQGYQNVNNFWDGQNGSREAPAGTYFYVIDLPGTGRQFKGYVELVK